MSKLTVELDVFSNVGATFDEEGNVFPSQSLDEAIIAVAAEKLLALDVPDESEKGYRRTDKVRALLTEKIEEAVNQRIAAVTMDEVDKAVRAEIESGWQKTNEYGTPTGRTLTLKDRVSEFLNAPADSYNRETRIQKALKEAIEGALKTVFNDEIEKARVAFREQLNGVLQAKLRESLANALGLKA